MITLLLMNIIVLAFGCLDSSSWSFPSSNYCRCPGSLSTQIRNIRCLQLESCSHISRCTKHTKQGIYRQNSRKAFIFVSKIQALRRKVNNTRSSRAAIATWTASLCVSIESSQSPEESGPEVTHTTRTQTDREKHICQLKEEIRELEHLLSNERCNHTTLNGGNTPSSVYQKK